MRHLRLRDFRRPLFAGLLGGAMLTLPVGLAGCEDQEPDSLEEVGENLDDAVDDAADAIEDAGDEIEDSLGGSL